MLVFILGHFCPSKLERRYWRSAVIYRGSGGSCGGRKEDSLISLSATQPRFRGTEINGRGFRYHKPKDKTGFNIAG